MKKHALQAVLSTLIAFLASGCTPAPLLCILNFTDVRKTYRFDFSKEKLKDKIIGLYTYKAGILRLNLGKNVIENTAVNAQYRQSTAIWLDKSNWNRFASDIRENTADTLHIIIGKHQSREQIQLRVIIEGDTNHSTLTIEEFSYRRRAACNDEKAYYLVRLTERIEKKFTSQLK